MWSRCVTKPMQVAKERRELDAQIQATNWAVDLVE
jgi:hypothetical protein